MNRWRRTTRITRVGLVFCLLMMAGVGILWLQYINLEADAAHQRAWRLQQESDALFDEAELVANGAARLFDWPCDNATRAALRNMAAGSAAVRDIGFIKQGKWACTTSVQLAQRSPPVESWPARRLQLNPDGGRDYADYIRVIPQAGGSVAVVLNGWLIATRLQALDNADTASLRVGPEAQRTEPGARQLVSTRYPLSVNWHNDYRLMPVLAGQRYTLLLLALLSAAIALLVNARPVPPSALINALKRGLRDKAFIPYYQPVVATHNGALRGVEVLVRWQHPQEGLIMPDIFIPQAEKSGLITAITIQLMEQVVADCRQLAGSYGTGYHIAINVSGGMLLDQMFLKKCLWFTRQLSQLNAVALFEITEREPVEFTHRFYHFIKRLHQYGAQIALDDFGTGYSNLAYIAAIQPAYLKIDRAFIVNMGHECISTVLVDTIINLSRELDIAVIAEGVETDWQYHYMQQQRVAYIQGCYFSKPLPQEALAHYIADQTLALRDESR